MSRFSLSRLFMTEERRPALLWRVLGFAIAFGVCLALREPLENVLETVVSRLGLGLPALLIARTVVVASVIGATVGVTYVFRRFVDRRPWAGMAMPPPARRWREIAAGFGLGAGMMLVVVGIELGLGWFRVLGVKPGFGGATVLVVLTSRLIHFIGTAVCEETAYRSYLLQNFGESYALWFAVLTTGAMFALSHFASNGFGWGFVVGGIVATFLWALMRLFTRAIWLGVGWHLGWDWFEDSLGLVPGYSPLQTERVGPALWVGRGLAIEGGLLIIIVLAAGFAGLLWSSRRRWRLMDWGATLSVNGEIQTSRPGSMGRDDAVAVNSN